MMGVRGQVQREGEVIHVIAQRLEDLSSMLASVGHRQDVADIYRVSRADVVKSAVGTDPRDPESRPLRSEEHTSELQSLMRISYTVFCLNNKININTTATLT